MVFLGIITNADGCLFCCDVSCAADPTPTPAFDAQGRRIFFSSAGQFVIVVEGVAGLSGAVPGTTLRTSLDRPDLQIESTQKLGNGSVAVCDTGPASSGGDGVPGINPPSFAPDDPVVTDVLKDFACRFQAYKPSAPCTFTDASGEHKLVNPGAAVQFCDFVASTAEFWPGDSLLSVKLRDTLGNLGPTAQIVVRVTPPTPKP